MKNQKIYEPEDKMIDIIRDNCDILQSLGGFGISLGFGDKTVQEVCESEDVDTYTFLSIVNLAINGYYRKDEAENISVPTLLKYLKASHAYYIEFQLPFMRKELAEALDENDSLAQFILKLYDENAHEIIKHMRYEEKTVFPYVEQLLKGVVMNNYDVNTFSQHHRQVEQRLSELKSIIIKYLPSDELHNNLLTATLYDIYNSEAWLNQHSDVEDKIFMPAIRQLEKNLSQQGVSLNIANMLNPTMPAEEKLSDREREIIIGIVKGLSNKEIADELCISVNTVITHRRNIARKLQIHSPAGLTIYAIVNHLVDISNVKL